MKQKIMCLMCVGLLYSMSYAQSKNIKKLTLTLLPSNSVYQTVGIRIPTVRGTVVPRLDALQQNSRGFSIPQTRNMSANLERTITLAITNNRHPLITNQALLQDAESSGELSQLFILQSTLEQTWKQLSKSSDWNFRSKAEENLSKTGVKLDRQDTILDILTLEQYILHTGKWPRNMEDPQEAKLSKKIAEALHSNYKEYIVDLRRQASNIPTTKQTIVQVEKFIKTYKRVPGAIYLLSTNVESLPLISAEEKLLGADLQFLVETNIAYSQGQENASLARLRDLWNCYSGIYFGGGIPELSSQGKPNIPVLSMAQWQKKLSRRIYSQPITFLMYGFRNYQEILQFKINSWKSLEIENINSMSEEEFKKWKQDIQQEKEISLKFENWGIIEQEEALLYAAQMLGIESPKLTQEQWDAMAQQWQKKFGGRILPPETIHSNNIPFSQLSAMDRLKMVIGQIYYNHVYPEQYLKELRQQGKF